MEFSEIVTIVVTVPESHAEIVREAIGRAGGGKLGNYTHCSFSVKGIGRFLPTAGSKPYLGKEGVLEEVIEERIETICSRAVLSQVIAEIKKVHPYEEVSVDVYPRYSL